MPRTFYTYKTARDPMDTTPPKPSRRELPLEFSASGSEYFRIWIVNLLLTIVTLSLYLPFAKARRLRYFYANTLVDGQPLAFHGNPWTILGGQVVMVACGFAFWIGIQTDTALWLLALPLFILLWPALWHSSLTYYAKNTNWGNLSFQFSGTMAGAYKASIPLLVLLLLLGAIFIKSAHLQLAATTQAVVSMLVLLMLALVFAAASWAFLKRYQQSGYCLADERAASQISVPSVLALELMAFGLAVVGILTSVALTWGSVWAMEQTLEPAGKLGGRVLFVAVFLVILAFAFLTTLAAFSAPLFAWGFLSARLQNLLWTGTRSQQLVFLSRLSARSLGWLNLKSGLLTIVTLGMYRPFAVVASTRLKLHAVRIGQYGDLG
jgi:uncharacterized membrane protein YjgN (DUF898 family)